MAKAIQEAEDAVAKEAVTAVRDLVGREARQSTGHFASRVVADRASGDRVRVHTPGLVYGPWIEGVSRRNQISSYKGIRPFRRVRDELDARAGQIADRVIEPRIRELNG
jgi:hypothetical protein